MFPGARPLEINTCTRTFATLKAFGLPNAPHDDVRQAVRIIAIKNRKIKLIFNKIIALQ